MREGIETDRHRDRQTNRQRAGARERERESLFVGWLLNVPATC